MLRFRTAGYSGYSVQYSPFLDNKIAVATAANFGLVGNGRLYILDIGNDGLIRPDSMFDTQDGLFSVAWSEIHENHVVTANGDGSIKIFDTKSQQPFPIKVYQEHVKEVFGVDWNLVDKNIFCSCSWDGSIKIWNPNAPQSILTLQAPSIQPPNNIQTQTQLTNNQNHNASNKSSTNCIYTAKFSPHEATSIASAHSDSTIRLFDIRTNNNSQQPAIIPNSHSNQECLTLDWNKYRPFTIASGGVDKMIKIWDIRKLNSPINELNGHDLPVRNVSWSPHDADVLMSTSYDTTVRVWRDQADVAHVPRINHSKGLMSVFDKHSEFAIGSDWSLWGQPGWVATVGWDENLYIWKAS